MIGDAVVALLDARARGKPVSEGLFFVVARRRGCDDLRRRARRETQAFEGFESVAPDLDALEEAFLLRLVRRSFRAREPATRLRMEALVRELAQGCTWAEACRRAGVPRGSQTRFRDDLKRVFERDRARPKGRSR